MATLNDRRRAFRRLHATGCFVIPNPWDIGTARYLQHLGFAALATTSAGASFALGRPDGAVGREEMLAHIGSIARATDLPVNADYMAGYAEHLDGLVESVRMCVATGVAGLSVEDGTDDPACPLYDLDDAVARVRAARAAIDGTGADVLLTARAECFIAGRPDLDEAVRRLRAYADAGADCLYAPGIRTREQITALVRAVAPKPVNVRVSAPMDLSVEDLAALGVRRISTGSALARAAWGGFIRAAREIAASGRFDALGDAVPFAELDGLFRRFAGTAAPLAGGSE
jgi:2-methylisocitrate lyase-like PEP mutase family enzyme